MQNSPFLLQNAYLKRKVQKPRDPDSRQLRLGCNGRDDLHSAICENMRGVLAGETVCCLGAVAVGGAVDEVVDLIAVDVRANGVRGICLSAVPITEVSVEASGGG